MRGWASPENETRNIEYTRRKTSHNTDLNLLYLFGGISIVSAILMPASLTTPRHTAIPIHIAAAALVARRGMRG
jgi:hypothetical protein